METKEKKQIKLVGFLHFVGNILGGGVLGTVLAAAYLMFTDDITPKAKEVIYDIINFNISFYIYMVVSLVLIIVLIGIPMLLIGSLIWLIILIIGFIKHLAGETYKYPLSLELLKIKDEL